MAFEWRAHKWSAVALFYIQTVLFACHSAHERRAPNDIVIADWSKVESFNLSICRDARADMHYQTCTHHVWLGTDWGLQLCTQIMRLPKFGANCKYANFDQAHLSLLAPWALNCSGLFPRLLPISARLGRDSLLNNQFLHNILHSFLRKRFH